MKYFTAPLVAKDPALLKHQGDLKFAQFAHLNEIVDELNALAPALHALAATTANITLSGIQTIDGVTLAVGDVVLVKDQSTGAENGLYTVKDANWIRNTRLKEAVDFVEGRMFTVSDGTVNGNSVFMLDYTGVFEVGVTTPSFAAVSGAAALSKVYLPFAEASGYLTAGDVAGTYPLGQGAQAVLRATGTATPISLVYCSSTGWSSVLGVARTMILTGMVSVNATAPTGNFTLGLYPVTATSGGAGVTVYTLGTVVTGSTCTFTAPAANAVAFSASSAFNMPSAGVYAIAVVTTATVAASSNVHLNARLGMIAL